jgi:hypothetical protein
VVVKIRARRIGWCRRIADDSIGKRAGGLPVPF